MEITLRDLAALVGGAVSRGSPDMVLRGFAAIGDAGPEDLTFFGNDRYLVALQRSSAGAALVPEGFAGDSVTVIAGLVCVANPSAAFAEVVRKFGAPPRAFRPGVHPTAVIDPGAQLDPDRVSVGAHAVIEAGCRIGDGTSIGHGCVIGEATAIGRDCLLHANVTVREGTRIGDRVILHSGCVIGADGFGYDLVDGRFQKIEQVGTVELGDDVEVGACATVDRARFGCTRIGEGTKIDNLVQVAHNCVIGKHCAAAAQVGISGSARVGDHVMLAGKAGVSGHVSIADGAVVMGMSGVTKDLTAPGKYLGFPAVPEREELKLKAALRKLPGLLRRVRVLEERLAAGSGAAGEAGASQGPVRPPAPKGGDQVIS